MHGVMAAELAALGFTANEDIIDGDDGVARLLGREVGDPEKVLDGLGTWDMATRGSTMRLHASLRRRRTGARTRCSSIAATAPDRPGGHRVDRGPAAGLPDAACCPYHEPADGSRGEVQHRVRPRRPSRSTGEPGCTSTPTRRCSGPPPRSCMKRVEYVPVEGDLRE